MQEIEYLSLDKRFSTTRRVYFTQQSLLSKLDLPGKSAGGLRIKGYGKRSHPDAPLVTIITAVYNAVEQIEGTIQSILHQGHENIEYIVVDGGSSDGTLDIIKSYDQYIDLWISEPDKGVYDAMNKGIAMATGDWLNFINAGDRLLHLDVQSLHQTSTCYCYDERSGEINRRPLAKSYLCRNMPYHQSIFYKKSEIEYYDLKYAVTADFEQMTRILHKIEKGGTNNSIVFYNIPGLSKIEHNESLGSLAARLKQRSAIIRSNLGFPFYLLSIVHAIQILARKLFQTFLHKVRSCGPTDIVQIIPKK